MKRLILALSLTTLALSGCAQLKNWYQDANSDATAGGSAYQEQSPFPKSSSNIAGN